MKYVFMSGRLERQAELRSYADQLKNLGIQVTSNWLWEDIPDAEVIDASPGAYPVTAANIRLARISELRHCDTVLVFTEHPGTMSRGNRHIEYGIAVGMAMTRKLRIIIIGPVELLLHADSNTVRFDSFTEMLDSRRADIWQ